MKGKTLLEKYVKMSTHKNKKSAEKRYNGKL